MFLRDDISQSKTNRCNSDFSFIKKAYDLRRTILFKKCTAETLIMHNKSAYYINFNEAISPVKLFGASLNRNSGKNRRQKQN